MKFLNKTTLTISLFLSLQPTAHAIELNTTGFATIGYAQSTADFNYLRFINNDGTFKRDSLLGMQFNAKFSPQWSATVQAVAAMPQDTDKQVKIDPRWGFIAFRPHNEWLIRAGKLRNNLLMNLQNLEVGTTYDMVRLPSEVYGTLPTYDFTGLDIVKSWYLDDYDVELELLHGQSDSTYRYYVSDTQLADWQATAANPNNRLQPIYAGILQLLSGLNSEGNTYFWPLDVTTTGATLSLTDDSMNLFRVAVYNLKVDDPTIAQINGGKPVINLRMLSLGTRYQLPASVSFSGEYLLNSNDTSTNVDIHSGYVSLSKRIKSWQPYITYAKLWTMETGESASTKLNQSSLAIGSSYKFSTTQKLKAEISHVMLGDRVDLERFDTDASNTAFNVFSINYNLTF